MGLDLLLTLVVLRVASCGLRGYRKSTRYPALFSFFHFCQNAGFPCITRLVHASHFGPHLRIDLSCPLRALTGHSGSRLRLKLVVSSY